MFQPGVRFPHVLLRDEILVRQGHLSDSVLDPTPCEIPMVQEGSSFVGLDRADMPMVLCLRQLSPQVYMVALLLFIFVLSPSQACNSGACG